MLCEAHVYDIISSLRMEFDLCKKKYVPCSDPDVLEDYYEFVICSQRETRLIQIAQTATRLHPVVLDTGGKFVNWNNPDLLLASKNTIRLEHVLWMKSQNAMTAVLTKDGSRRVP